jgi:hypothetical protein
MAQMSDCTSTTEAICDGKFPPDTQNHTKYECSADLFSSVELPSCENGNANTIIFWFWYNDVCRLSTTLNTPFATVSFDNVTTCRDVSTISITKDSCENNYNITRRSMIIKNITNSTAQKYICIHGRSYIDMMYSSAVIYSINISSKFI